MKTSAKGLLLTMTLGIVMLTTVGLGSPNAGLHVGVTYSSAPADVRVWLGRGYDHHDYYYDDYYYEGDYEYDVYPSPDDVVLYVTASRSCYTTVYVIDNLGYLHVIHPLSPFDDAYLIGGRVYRYCLRDFGFYRPCFGRGVAYAFAVTSPVPFSFTQYGVGLFGPQINFQVYGDPFMASRLFYFSILPVGCRRGLVAVSYARFYIREYVRYPSYLCLGWHDYHGTWTYCRGDCAAHRQYRIHAKDPYRVIHPAREIRHEYTRHAKINRTPSKDIREIRRVSRARSSKYANDRKLDRETKRVVSPSRLRSVGSKTDRSIVSKRTARHIESPTDVRKTTRTEIARTVASKSPSSKSSVKTPRKATGQERVVRSTRNSFIKSKSEYAKLREKLENRTNKNRSGSKKASAREAGADKDKRVRKETRKKVAQSNPRAQRQVKAGKDAKRAKP